MRRSLPPHEHAVRSESAAASITRSKRFTAGARVAIYVPFDRETDTAALLAAALRRGVRVYVPVVTDVRHRRMSFYPWSGRTRRGTFGISIPHRRGRPLGARWFDLIVVPLVGADRAGYRLGVGGGFYDRVLAFRRLRRRWMGPCLLGLGFDDQRVDAVFADPWDVRLDGLATESGLEHFPRDPLHRS